MKARSMSFLLRLPLSLRAAVERQAQADGTSINQFLVMAAAEKLASLHTAEAFFAERCGKGDKALALAFLRDGGGEKPRPDDALPPQ